MHESGHQELEQVARLLALKRHETPPPGYFVGFSAKVTARIVAAGLQPRRAWWERGIEAVLGRPLYAGFGGLVGGVLLVGFLSSGDAVSVSADSTGLVWSAPAVLAVDQRAGVEAAGSGLTVPYAGASSVTPLLERPSPFGKSILASGSVQRVSYTPLP